MKKWIVPLTVVFLVWLSGCNLADAPTTQSQVAALRRSRASLAGAALVSQEETQVARGDGLAPTVLGRPAVLAAKLLDFFGYGILL